MWFCEIVFQIMRYYTTYYAKYTAISSLLERVIMTCWEDVPRRCLSPICTRSARAMVDFDIWLSQWYSTMGLNVLFAQLHCRCNSCSSYITKAPLESITFLAIMLSLLWIYFTNATSHRPRLMKRSRSKKLIQVAHWGAHDGIRNIEIYGAAHRLVWIII